MNQKLNENRGCIVYDIDSHYTKVTGQHILGGSMATHINMKRCFDYK